MVILGINGQIILNTSEREGPGYVHHSGVALIKDGKLCNALCEERLSRRKYDGDFPIRSINEVLRINNLTKNDVDIVAYVPNTIFMIDREKSFRISQFLIREHFPNAEIKIVNHHLSHACASFLTSPFDKANVLTFDNCGDFYYDRHYGLKNNFTYSTFTKNSKEVVNHVYNYSQGASWYGLGTFYTDMSSIVWTMLKKANVVSDNFGEGTEGKVMGLAAFGDSSRIPYENPFIVLQNFPDEFPKIFYKYNYQLGDLFLKSNIYVEDTASWMQKVFSETLLEFFKLMPKRYKEDYLCMSGGCSLNIITNSLLLEKGYFKDSYICSVPNDEGLSLGAALYEAWYQEKELIIPHNTGLLGIEYSNEEVMSTIQNHKDFDKVTLLNQFKNVDEFYNKVVELILEKDCIAWFQGANEYGPRALGNRSILGNPEKDLKNYLNEKVKFREKWRPYAGIVLQESVHDYFNFPKTSSPYMMYNGYVKLDKLEKLKGIVHYDKSCRIQTVSKDDNYPLYLLLKKFQEATSVPVLLNTSFNIKGEPIVQTPSDALKSFFECDLDVLVIDSIILIKK